MPYKVIKKGEKYLLCKENPDGSVGRVIADHKSKKKAEAQMRAIYASEGRSKE
jgi:hypothetical protein